MGKTLTIHVGMGKTGTSALQKFLREETDYLAARGIHYAGERVDRLTGYGGIPKNTSVSTPEHVSIALGEMARFAAERDDISRVVWSNEVLAQSLNAAETSAVIGAFAAQTDVFDAIEIVLVFRRQDEWFESAYRQWGLKHKLQEGHHNMTPEAFLDAKDHQFDYLGIYETWSAVASTQVHLYDDLRAAGGIVQYFCGIWGLEPLDAFEKYNSIHGSLGPSQVNFVALYNRIHDERVRDFQLGKMMRQYDLPELSDKGEATVPQSLREQALLARVIDNATLAQKLGREQLFHEEPVSKPVSYDNTVEDALSYLIHICREQSGEIQRLRNRLNRLEKRLDG